MSAADSHTFAAGDTHVGRRKHNEDCYLIDAELGLIVVADGVGGQHAGEVASKLTCEVIAREVGNGLALKQAIETANREVREAVAQGVGRDGMATTVVAVQRRENSYDVAWVGDSRLYLWDGKVLHLLTRDHSFVEALVQKGKITREEAKTHPQRNTILQAIGLMDEHEIHVGINQATPAAGDTLLLCSDGLFDVLDSPQLVEQLSSPATLETQSKTMVQAALEGGGRDNITAVLHSATTDMAGATNKSKEEVWSYDSVTSTYGEGTPYTAPVQTAIARPTVRKIAPREPFDPQTTMMSSNEMAEAVRASAKQKMAQQMRATRRKAIIGSGIALAVVSLLILWILRG